MFIKELHVDGYGVLRDARLSFEMPITVVYGPNEAGKTTLLRFIRSMLYGFPTRHDPVERGEPAYGGRHGGRLAVRTASGRELLVERHADGGARGARRSSGGLIVRDADGIALGWTQAEWEQQVLGGVSERLFRQLFAVSLNELHELLTLQGEEIGNYLYHAGLAGGAALAEARRQLAAEMDKLYRPKGTTQPLNRLLASMKELEAELRESRGQLAQFLQAELDLDETNRQLAAIAELIPEKTREAAALQSALDMREWWLKRQALLREEQEWQSHLTQKDLPLLPETFAAEWAFMKQQRDAAVRRLEELRQTVRARLRERELLHWDAVLLDNLPALERLESMRVAIAAKQDEKETLLAEHALLDDAIRMMLPRLSADWTETQLQRFVGIVSEKEPLVNLQQAWNESIRNRDRLEADAARIRRQLASWMDWQHEASDLQREPPVSVSADEPGMAGGPSAEPMQPRDGMTLPGDLRPRTRAALQATWNTLEDEVRRLEKLRAEWLRYAPAHGTDGGRTGRSPQIGRSMGRSDRAMRDGNRRRTNATYVLAASVALAMLAVLLVLGSLHGFLPETATGPGMVVAGGCAVLAITAARTAWKRRRNGNMAADEAEVARSAAESVQSQMQLARNRAEALLGELLADASSWADRLLDGRDRPAGIPPQLDEEIWVRLRQAVQSRLAELEARERDAERLRERQQRIREWNRELAAVESEMHHIGSRMETLLAQWSEWLGSVGLSANLTPDSLPELLRLAEQGQDLLRRRAAVESRMAAIEQVQASFREAAAALFRVCPPPGPLADDPALAVAWLQRQSVEQRKAKVEAERLDQLIKEAEAAELEAQSALMQVEAQLARQIAAAGEPDEAALERRLAVDERRRALLRERKEIEVRLEAGRSQEALASLYALLEAHDEATLRAMYQAAEEARQDLVREQSALLDRRGRLTAQLERLSQEAETEDRLQRLADLESAMAMLAERYAVLALADRLLNDTRKVFEEEKQPGVLLRASRYFAEMTGGAYARILVPPDKPDIRVETTDRRQLDSAFLSRGAQEQLYLAMRFALVDAISPQTPLPLLLDDLFVHFDQQRLKRTVGVLGQLAETRQILLFTCHRHVAEAVRQSLPSARIMHWALKEAEGRAAAVGPGK
jgi:uncharacterized protein YhaN